MTNVGKSIREDVRQIKRRFSVYEQEILFTALLVLVAVLSFVLGRISASSGDGEVPISVMRAPEADMRPMYLGGEVVGSRTGKKYHFPWCSGAQSMSEQNKVWFNTIEDARAAGYTPAGNCKGLR